jgi:hypothetical protein
MATAARIYTVAGKDGKTRLIEATHPAHALRHVAADTFTVKVATQRELVDALRRGVNVEAVKHEQQELPTT